MRTFGILMALIAGLVSSSWANPADQLDAVANELEAIVTELEKGQAQATELKSRLASLQALSEEHLSTLRAQESLLADYRVSVAALEERDRASTERAKMWQSRWEFEKTLNSWLLPAAGVVLAVALVEGLLLVVAR